MNTFQIDDKEVNVEEIMRTIRENILTRKKLASFSGHPPKSLNEASCQFIGVDNLDLNYINSNWDIKNNSYFISSHRPIVGKFLVKGRELVHGEIRRYIDPVVWKQIEFNASVVRINNDSNNRFISLEDQISKIRLEMNSKMDAIESEFNSSIVEINNESINQAKSLDDQISKLRIEMNNRMHAIELEFNNNIEKLRSQTTHIIETEVKDRISLIDAQLHRIEQKIQRISSLKADFSAQDSLEMNYFQFENNFRGHMEDIKERQFKFIDYFKGCSNVLDIGCGRGEFLELLGDHSIGGRGIDIDDTMVDHCLSKGLNVEQKDAIMYLEALDDETLDGIFIDQVVEHLEPNYLIRLLTLCAKKMKPGFYIVVETVNPLSFSSFANFYIDLTHIKPVHPGTLNYLLASCGFNQRETKFISPIPNESRLKKIQSNDVEYERNQKMLEVCNNNIDMLNNILYGAQDYAIIGKK